VAKYLKDLNVDCEKIFSGPTPRALQTSEILQKRLNVPIERIHSLTEFYLGILEDRSRREGLVLSPDEYEAWEKNLLDFNPPLGESALEAAERFYETVELISQNCQCRDVIIVSHGIVIKLFLATVLKKSLEIGEKKIDVPWTTHGTISVFTYNNQQFKFREVIENKFPDSKEVADFG